MSSIKLKYTPIGGSLTETTLSVRAIRGSSSPDDFDIFPGIRHDYLNGTMEEQIKGFRRNITIDFGVITDLTKMKAILYFLLDPARQLDLTIAAPTGVGATVLVGGSLTAVTTYYYKVTAYDDIGETLGSTEVSGTTTTNDRQIRLSWNTVSGARGYKVYRTQVAGNYGTTSFLAYVDSTIYTDTGTVALTSGSPPTSTTISVALAEPDGYANEWIDGVSLGRKFVVNVKESSIRTAFPV